MMVMSKIRSTSYRPPTTSEPVIDRNEALCRGERKSIVTDHDVEIYESREAQVGNCAFDERADESHGPSGLVFVDQWTNVVTRRSID